MEHLVLSSQERSSGSLSSETLERACNQVMLNGFVLLANALSTDFVDKIYEDWINLANHLLENVPKKTDVGIFSSARSGFGWIRRSVIRIRIRSSWPTLSRCRSSSGSSARIVGFATTQATRHCRAPTIRSCMRTISRSSRVRCRPAYRGVGGQFPFDRRHRGQRTDGRVAQLPSAARKAYSAARIPDAARSIEPTKMLTPKGSMLIWDVRMWHRGTPNRSNQIRPNLALIYTRSWWDGAFYPQDSLGITRTNYESLPERAKQLFAWSQWRLVAFDRSLPGAEPTEIPGCGVQALLSRLSIFDLDKGSAKSIHATTTHIEAPNWTPDGTALIVNGSGRLYRVPLSAPGLEAIDAGFAVNINNDHGVSPDGKSLVISNSTENGDSCIYALPISGGTPRKITELTPSYWHGWSPDGRTLLYVGKRGATYQVYTCPFRGGVESNLRTPSIIATGPTIRLTANGSGSTERGRGTSNSGGCGPTGPELSG